MTFLMRYLATSAVIKSKPGAFFSEYVCILSLTLFRLKYLSVRLTDDGRFRKMSTSFTCWIICTIPKLTG